MKEDHRLANNLLRIVLVLTFWLAGPRAVSAEPSLTEKAAAEALFQQGVELLAEGSVKEACAKFEASQQLDSALGTTLRLADCYDRVGKTASAWALFKEAAAQARSQQQPTRETIALERAHSLESRLSHLQIDVASSTRELDGIEIYLNGTSIPRGSWGTPMPVDPGVQHIKAEAPGHEAWETDLEIAEESDERTLSIPPLVAIETPARPAESVAPSAGQNATVDRSAVLDADQSFEDPGATQRTLGYIGLGLGAVSLGAAGYFVYRASDLNSQSLDHCIAGETTACDREGKALRDDARTNGTFATITSAAGFVLLGGAAVVLFTAPSDERHGRSTALNVAARTTSTSLGLEVEGTW